MKTPSAKQLTFLIITLLLLLSCSSKSVGEQRAQEVIKRINNGITGPELQEQINKDGEELKGQDLLDYYEVLQQYGVF